MLAEERGGLVQIGDRFRIEGSVISAPLGGNARKLFPVLQNTSTQPLHSKPQHARYPEPCPFNSPNIPSPRAITCLVRRRQSVEGFPAGGGLWVGFGARRVAEGLPDNFAGMQLPYGHAQLPGLVVIRCEWFLLAYFCCLFRVVVQIIERSSFRSC